MEMKILVNLGAKYFIRVFSRRDYKTSFVMYIQAFFFYLVYKNSQILFLT